jgi:uncharacterized membrane protein
VKEKRLWLVFAFVTASFWGVWGAFIEIPEKSGFPTTLGYVVWSLTMIPCALFALHRINWKPETDKRSVFNGTLAGLLGCGGQLLLFQALRHGPAYIVFPIVSLSPVITIFLSLVFLKERANFIQWVGIFLSLIAMFLLANPQVGPVKSESDGIGWLILTFLVFAMWGIQMFMLKFSNNTMKAESIFFYTTLASFLFIPIAIYMTDFSVPVNWGFRGPGLTAMIQILNAIGALCLMYALRYGKAIVVVPLTGLAPVITVILSLIFYAVMPGGFLLAGLVVASISISLLSI